MRNNNRIRVLARLNRKHAVILQITVMDSCVRITQIKYWDGELPLLIANNYESEHSNVEAARKYVVNRLADYFKEVPSDDDVQMLVCVPRNRIQELEGFLDKLTSCPQP